MAFAVALGSRTRHVQGVDDTRRFGHVEMRLKLPMNVSSATARDYRAAQTPTRETESTLKKRRRPRSCKNPEKREKASEDEKRTAEKKDYMDFGLTG